MYQENLKETEEWVCAAAIVCVVQEAGAAACLVRLPANVLLLRQTSGLT